MTTGGAVATVLIVDDEQSLRTYMARVLESEGYAVIEAENGVEALSLLSRKDGVVVDLVITDVRMPGMGGSALAASLAQDRTSPPVLFVSGSHMPSDVSGPLLRKPFMPDDLSAFARELLQIPPASSSYEQPGAHPR